MAGHHVYGRQIALHNLQLLQPPTGNNERKQLTVLRLLAKCSGFTVRSKSEKRLRRRKNRYILLLKARYKRACTKAFDSTLGFPGEGWQQFKVATWNTRSLTAERFQYAKQLGYDVLAITELWRKQTKYQTRRKQFIVGTPKLIEKGPKKGQKRFPNDRAAGTGILLSPRMEKKVHSCLRIGGRARLLGQTTRSCVQLICRRGIFAA